MLLPFPFSETRAPRASGPEERPCDDTSFPAAAPAVVLAEGWLEPSPRSEPPPPPNAAPGGDLQAALPGGREMQPLSAGRGVPSSTWHVGTPARGVAGTAFALPSCTRAGPLPAALLPSVPQHVSPGTEHPASFSLPLSRPGSCALCPRSCSPCPKASDFCPNLGCAELIPPSEMGPLCSLHC